MFVSCFKSVFKCSSGFHTPPPTSRPPTKIYDRQSYVLVISVDDDITKFMKLHLNKFFSHVVVKKHISETLKALQEYAFDLVIADISEQNQAFHKLYSEHAKEYKHIPYVLLDSSQQGLNVLQFPEIFVIDIVPPPYDLDTLHCAIRRALNVRNDLRELSSLVPNKYPLGQLIRKAVLPSHENRAATLVRQIRERLTEEIDA